MSMKISAIPAFQDNYIWLLHDTGSQETAVVDPGDAEPVLALLERSGLRLNTILITHHHADHTGGVRELAARYSPEVIGPHNEHIAGITRRVAQGDSFELMGRPVQVLEVPGHTLDHIAFFLPATETADPVLFCGDTLFAAGCGRLFEGSAAQMRESLQKLVSLPAETAVHCAHEYTLANLAFARAVEPDSADLGEYGKRMQERLDKEGLTLPSTIADELRTNPFLRCHRQDVRNSVAEHTGNSTLMGAEADETAVFAELRRWKDNFRAAS